MVEGGVLGWLLRLLADQEPLSEYTLRYTLALLMNLCLRTAGETQLQEGGAALYSVSTTAGKKVCVPLGSVALKVLGELLEHEDQEVRCCRPASEVCYCHDIQHAPLLDMLLCEWDSLQPSLST